ncbi:MAG: hypothetical protein KBD06_04620, partial [Candidatus Pacebacteria bacterium]|nr:hypothetical protein [Candidatus Paceibacterota bacterium]
LVPASGESPPYGYGQGTYYGYGQGTYYGYGQSTYYGYGQGSYTPTETSYTPAQTSYQSSYTTGQSSYAPAQSSYAPAQSSYTPSGTCWDGSLPGAGGSCPPCPLGYELDSQGRCIPPPAPGFTSFTTTQGFVASGHLEVRPSLVRSGDPTRVYWNVTNVRDCTVRGTNGDGSSGGQWNALTSGPSGVVTSGIGSRTDYTLFCRSLVGATPSTITETRTVNVIPRWFEPAGQ